MKEAVIKTILTILGVVFLVFFALSPFVYMIVVSFADNPNFLVTGSPNWTLQNYVNILTVNNLHFKDYFLNSLIISTITSVLVSLVASLAGYAVSRMRFPGRIAIPLAVLALSMFPQVSIVGYLAKIFSTLGWTNSLIALILPYIAWTVPVALWINLSYFSQIPMDLDRAALVDGAGRFKTLFKIILPLALPGIFSGFLLVFIACFNEFLFAMLLTTDYTAQTLPVGIALFQGIHGEIPWGNIMAASALASVPLVILTLLFQRYIVQGIMGGAVKG